MTDQPNANDDAPTRPMTADGTRAATDATPARPDARAATAADCDHPSGCLDAVAGGEYLDDRIRLND